MSFFVCLFVNVAVFVVTACLQDVIVIITIVTIVLKDSLLFESFLDQVRYGSREFVFYMGQI